MKKTYSVQVAVTSVYRVLVDAEDWEEAENEALASYKEDDLHDYYTETEVLEEYD